MAIGDVFRVALQGRLLGQVCINNFYYRQGTADVGGQSSFNSLASAFGDTVYIGYLQCVSNEYAAERLLISRLKPTASAAVEYTVTQTGNLSGSLPPSCSAVIRRRGVGPPKQARGRIYLPGVPRSAVVGGTLTTAFIGLTYSLRVEMRQVISTEPTPGAFVSFQPVLWNALAGTTIDVIATTIDAILRSQRRREINVGV